jgi:hypothetical protein
MLKPLREPISIKQYFYDFIIERLAGDRQGLPTKLHQPLQLRKIVTHTFHFAINKLLAMILDPSRQH